MTFRDMDRFMAAGMGGQVRHRFLGGKKLQVTMIIMTARLLRTSPSVNCGLWRKLYMQMQPSVQLLL